MTRSIFGTDGIRGRVNSTPMTPEIALRVGMAAGRYFTRGDHRHRVVIGKDTRLSGYMFEPALAAGFVAVGMDVIMVGPMPTPAIGMLTKSLRADIGVMISASHNRYHDNGIKLFGPDGYKLTDGVEAKIQQHLQNGLDKGLVAPEDTGRAKRLEDVQGRYVEFVKSTVSTGVSLEGLKVVIDCANGAAYRVAPSVLWELGAEVVAVGVSPNGFNINDGCGSTNPEYMCEQVVAHGADFGIALDGDADRMVLSDENGKVVDGDQVMALIADDWAKSGRLRGGGIVATVMSNLGLERHLTDLGLNLARTQVGDRYVVEHMRAHDFNVGGEQSGHIVLNDFATTGDGLIAALQVLAVAVAEDLPASTLLSRFEPIPQILKNARYAVAEPLSHRAVRAAIEDAEKRLGSAGRLVIRMSGTEPVVRVMAEGDDPSLVDLVVSNICHEVETAA